MVKKIVKQQFKDYFRNNSESTHQLTYNNVVYRGMRNGKRIHIQRGGSGLDMVTDLKVTDGTIDFTTVDGVLFAEKDLSIDDRKTGKLGETKIGEDEFELFDYEKLSAADKKKIQGKISFVYEKDKLTNKNLITGLLGSESGTKRDKSEKINKIFQNKKRIHDAKENVDKSLIKINKDITDEKEKIVSKINKMPNYDIFEKIKSIYGIPNDMLDELHKPTYTNGANYIENIYEKYQKAIHDDFDESIPKYNDEWKDIIDAILKDTKDNKLDIEKTLNRDTIKKTNIVANYKDLINYVERLNNVYDSIQQIITTFNNAKYNNIPDIKLINNEINEQYDIYDTNKQIDINIRFEKIDEFLGSIKSLNENLVSNTNIDNFKYKSQKGLGGILVRHNDKQHVYESIIGSVPTVDKEKFHQAVESHEHIDKEKHNEYVNNYGNTYIQSLVNINNLTSQLKVSHIIIHLLILRERARDKDHVEHTKAVINYFDKVHEYNPDGKHKEYQSKIAKEEKQLRTLNDEIYTLLNEAKQMKFIDNTELYGNFNANVDEYIVKINKFVDDQKNKKNKDKLTRYTEIKETSTKYNELLKIKKTLINKYNELFGKAKKAKDFEEKQTPTNQPKINEYNKDIVDLLKFNAVLVNYIATLGFNIIDKYAEWFNKKIETLNNRLKKYNSPP